MFRVTDVIPAVAPAVHKMPPVGLTPTIGSFEGLVPATITCGAGWLEITGAPVRLATFLLASF